MSERIIKSKERVRKFAEVFTPDWLVRKMVDLLPEEAFEAGKTVLEPACGEGAFLADMDGVPIMFNVYAIRDGEFAVVGRSPCWRGTFCLRWSWWRSSCCSFGRPPTDWTARRNCGPSATTANPRR